MMSRNQDETQVVDLRGWRNEIAVNIQMEINNLPKQSGRCHHHELSFIAV